MCMYLYLYYGVLHIYINRMDETECERERVIKKGRRKEREISRVYWSHRSFKSTTRKFQHTRNLNFYNPVAFVLKSFRRKMYTR